MDDRRFPRLAAAWRAHLQRAAHRAAWERRQARDLLDLERLVAHRELQSLRATAGYHPPRRNLASYRDERDAKLRDARETLARVKARRYHPPRG